MVLRSVKTAKATGKRGKALREDDEAGWKSDRNGENLHQQRRQFCNQKAK